MRKNAQGLTPLQVAFCREYVKDMDAVQAAIRAGYRETTARMEAVNWLRKRHIAREVFRLLSGEE